MSPSPRLKKPLASTSGTVKFEQRFFVFGLGHRGAFDLANVVDAPDAHRGSYLDFEDLQCSWHPFGTIAAHVQKT